MNISPREATIAQIKKGMPGNKSLAIFAGVLFLAILLLSCFLAIKAPDTWDRFEIYLFGGGLSSFIFCASWAGSWILQYFKYKRIAGKPDPISLLSSSSPQTILKTGKPLRHPRAWSNIITLAVSITVMYVLFGSSLEINGAIKALLVIIIIAFVIWGIKNPIIIKQDKKRYSGMHKLCANNSIFYECSYDANKKISALGVDSNSDQKICAPLLVGQHNGYEFAVFDFVFPEPGPGIDFTGVGRLMQIFLKVWSTVVVVKEIKAEGANWQTFTDQVYVQSPFLREYVEAVINTANNQSSQVNHQSR
jgi:hypothetical protein